MSASRFEDVPRVDRARSKTAFREMKTWGGALIPSFRSSKAVSVVDFESITADRTSANNDKGAMWSSKRAQSTMSTACTMGAIGENDACNANSPSAIPIMPKPSPRKRVRMEASAAIP
eukprot:scaffold32972_cov28-Tisochrysis_lutea.AAC.16